MRALFLTAFVLALFGSLSSASAHDRAAYDAACRFIGRQNSWADSLAKQRAASSTEHLVGGLDGHRLFRYTEKGLELEYLVTREGQVFASRLSLSSPWLDRRHLSAARVAEQLHQPQPLPHKIKAGCDMLNLVIRSQRGQLRSLTISSLID